VPWLPSTNLHEFVNGLDRPDANAMGVEELNRMITEAFDGHSKAMTFGLPAGSACAKNREK